MNSVQRQFGRMLQKNPGDNARAAVVLSDYEDADRLLEKIADQTKSWHDAWLNIAQTQLAIVTEYEGLWDPIVGAANGQGRPAAATPELQLTRTLRLREGYAELKTELVEEIDSIDGNIIRPVQEARECIAPFKKMIKKRENLRLDFERAQEKTNKLSRKMGRNPKEDKALAKAEAEEAKIVEGFQVADEHLKRTLPPVVTATFSIIPPILRAMILVQNRMLGLYYTTLNDFSQEFGFMCPPPPMDEVVAVFNGAHDPARRAVEMLPCLVNSKGARVTRPPSMGMIDRPSGHDRKISSPSMPPVPGLEDGAPRTNRIPSAPSALALRQNVNYSAVASESGAPTDFTTASRLGLKSVPQSPAQEISHSYRQSPDYFAASKQWKPPMASSTSTPLLSAGKPRITSTSSTASAAAAAIQKKNKPPPPPPPPKKKADYVIARFAFVGEGSGDLSFQEGDRIRIVKRTPTEEDWWVGELRGVEGSFPANYCTAI